MFEGTGIYFKLIFLIIFIAYITVKICVSILFKKMSINSWKAYIPFYWKYVLVKKLELNNKLYFSSLIPIVNFYYNNIILKKLLTDFSQESKDSYLYFVIPMYKFPELVFKNPKFGLNEYALTEGFIETEKMIFNKPEQTIKDVNPQIQNTPQETIYTNQNLQEDKQQVTYVDAKKEEQTEKPPVQVLSDGKMQICPNCGARLSSSSKACFLCGHKL